MQATWKISASYTSPITGARMRVTLESTRYGTVVWRHTDSEVTLPFAWARAEAFDAVTWFLRVYADTQPEIHLT